MKTLNARPTQLAEVYWIEPHIFGDDRGFFFESFNARAFNQAIGRDVSFVQDNHSKSRRGVLRGLHLQTRKPQGKLIRVTQGVIFDVAVDLRMDSDTFGQWVGFTLDAEHHHQLWIPEGFGHGFLTLSETAEVQYKATDFYDPGHEVSVAWNDPEVAIDWPLDGLVPQCSSKDQAGLALSEFKARYQSEE